MTLTPTLFRSLLSLAAGIAAGPLAASPALADRMVRQCGEAGWRLVPIHGSSRVRPEEP